MSAPAPNQKSVQQHLGLLGMRVSDRVTGFCGVATSVTFDLYGCIQAIVNPGIGADGKLGEQLWFDVNRLVVVGGPVMEQPAFVVDITAADANKGPAERPAFIKP